MLRLFLGLFLLCLLLCDDSLLGLEVDLLLFSLSLSLLLLLLVQSQVLNETHEFEP